MFSGELGLEPHDAAALATGRAGVELADGADGEAAVFFFVRYAHPFAACFSFNYANPCGKKSAEINNLHVTVSEIA